MRMQIRKKLAAVFSSAVLVTTLSFAAAVQQAVAADFEVASQAVALPTQDPASYTIGDTVSGYVADGTLGDSYNVVVPETGLVTFAIETNQYDGHLIVQLTSNSGKSYKTEHSGAGVFSITQYLRAGAYSFSIKEGIMNGLGDVTDYTLTSKLAKGEAETYPETDALINDTQATAFSIPATGEITGVIDLSDSCDIYKFEVGDACEYRVTVNGLANDSGSVFEVGMSLRDAFDEISNSESRISGGMVYTYNLRKGTYYLSIAKSGSSQGVYTITTSQSPLPQPKVTSVKRTKSSWSSSRGLIVKWSRKASCSGYQVQIAKNKKCTKGKRTFDVSSNAVGKQEISDLKKNKKYYVRVRAKYSTGGSVYVYSGWSAVKAAQTKK